ncbi:hypothetical protein HDU98_002587 [Podochytrium sp. JEL0797]|nr:hypothetical protein HDU98_002587 [Podochytrium sp. JEL0797]
MKNDGVVEGQVWKCVQCGAGEADTPLKRKGPDKKRNYCNACYVRWRVKVERSERGSARPIVATNFAPQRQQQRSGSSPATPSKTLDLNSCPPNSRRMETELKNSDINHSSRKIFHAKGQKHQFIQPYPSSNQELLKDPASSSASKTDSSMALIPATAPSADTPSNADNPTVTHNYFTSSSPTNNLLPYEWAVTSPLTMLFPPFLSPPTDTCLQEYTTTGSPSNTSTAAAAIGPTRFTLTAADLDSLTSKDFAFNFNAALAALTSSDSQATLIGVPLNSSPGSWPDTTTTTTGNTAAFPDDASLVASMSLFESCYTAQTPTPHLFQQQQHLLLERHLLATATQPEYYNDYPISTTAAKTTATTPFWSLPPESSSSSTGGGPILLSSMKPLFTHNDWTAPTPSYSSQQPHYPHRDAGAAADPTYLPLFDGTGGEYNQVLGYGVALCEDDLDANTREFLYGGSGSSSVGNKGADDALDGFYQQQQQQQQQQEYQYEPVSQFLLREGYDFEGFL